MRSKQTIIVFACGLLGGVIFGALRKGGGWASRADWPVNFGHRGDSAHAPENTLESFRGAVEAGAGGLELDVHLTRDGKLVVIHDDTLERTTDGTGHVRDKAFAEIEPLDAGYHFTSDGSYSYRGEGLRVPTLEEVVQEFPGVALNIEIKEDQPGVEEAVLRTIQKAQAEGRTLVAAHNHAVIKRFREVSDGGISTSASIRETRSFFLLSRLGLEGSSKMPYDALQVPISYRGVKIVTPKFVEAVHGRGLRLDVWTIDEPEEMHWLLDLGVDVIMTNRPGALQEVLEQRHKV